jgi:MFS transporter, Spinster family, sphingosine-1-phosphate transporter
MNNPGANQAVSANRSQRCALALGSRRGLLVLGLLFLLNTVNFVDRQLPFILVGPIKADLGLTDTEIGLMAGLAFAVVYSFAGLGLARLADRWSTRKVLVLALSIWSLTTGLTGLVRNFGQLILCRMAVAGSEAGSTPTAHALIARTYSFEYRAMALAIFSLGVPVGSTLGLSLGGFINDHANWREAFLIVGLPGLLLAAICAVVLPDPAPVAATETPPMRFWSAVRYLMALRSFRHMAAGSALYACGSYAMNVFAGAFLVRVHHLSTTLAGLGFGMAFGVGGGLGTFAGGYFGDRLGRRDPRWRQRLPAIGQLLSAPAALGTWLVGDATLAVVLLTLTYFFGLLYFAPSFAVAQSLVPDQIRAMSSAVLLFCLTLVGSSAGPLVVGRVSDLLYPSQGALSLRYAMCLMAITMVWSAIHFQLAARALPKDLSRPELVA